MSLLPYALARPFLFSLDPEAAHELTLHALARMQGTPLQLAYCAARVDDPIELAGLTFPNRVGLAAGLDKNARCIDGLGAMGFGFVEVGTVTPLAQPGNPKPRMFRLPKAGALINRLGFNNDGLDAFIANVKRSSLYRQRQSAISPHQGRADLSGKARPMLLGLNIGKNAATPIEPPAMTIWPVSTASTLTPTMSPSTSPAPTPRTCARCKVMRRSTRCWVPLHSAVKHWHVNVANVPRFLSRSRPISMKPRCT